MTPQETRVFSLSDIRSMVEGTVFTGEDSLDTVQVEKAFASDLMSEVLTLLTDNLLLITGLNNIQAVRTAEMADIGAILFVRGKSPTEKMKELAESSGIVLLGTPYSMYRTGGILYTAGLGYVF
jgi:predicted transcriptional regulator